MATTAPPLTRLGVKPKAIDYLRSVWARREFALAIPRAELHAKHQDTVLGHVWHLLNPLLQVGVYYLVFAVVLDVSRGVPNFVGFLAIGVFVFHFTTRSATAGAKSLVKNDGLLKAIAFPRAILPLSVVLYQLASFTFALVAMFGIVLVTGEEPAATWLLIIPVIALQFLFNLGIAMFVARLTHHFRDVTQVLPFILRIWLYLSGVFWDPDRRLAEKAPELLSVSHANPAYTFIKLVRTAILDNTVGSPRLWLVAAGWSVGMLIFGFLFFRAREHEYGRG